MGKPLNITAVSGWAIPGKWFAEEVASAFPDSNIKVIYPEAPEDPEEAESLLQTNPAELYIGYSLGSLWLLRNKKFLPTNSIKALLAPILSFLEKDGLGGTTSETQLKYLSRIIKQNSDKSSSLENFFTYSNLPFPENMIDQIPDRKVLLKGLNFLRACRAKGEDAKNFLSIVGENDIFINGQILRQYIPKLDIIQGVGHAPGNLLRHLALRLKTEPNNS